MCYLCKLRDSAKNPDQTNTVVWLDDPLCVVVDTKGDKPTKDGFQRKVVIDRFHEMEPVPTTRDAIISSAKQAFPTRKLWFPQTEDHTENGKRLPLGELAAHWYFIIE